MKEDEAIYWYKFEDFLKVTHLSFISLEDKEKDYMHLALYLTNFYFNHKLKKQLLSCSGEDKEAAEILVRIFAPLVCSYYILKYYFNFSGECCKNGKEIFEEIESICSSEETFKNWQDFYKVKKSSPDCCL